jgi:hypothetical protein
MKEPNMDAAVIFIDDSELVLPKIKRWKQTLGRGTRIQNHEMILEILNKSNLPIPSENIELEQEYCNVLHDYIRPTQLMFAGLFVEVRLFYNELETVVPTQLYIVSGRYGLIEQGEEIIPYNAPMKSVDDLARLDKRTEFSKRMQSVLQDKKFIIMSFPMQYYMFLLERQWFTGIDDDQLLFTISGSGMKEQLTSVPGFRWIQKRGVARIGKKNQASIIDMIRLSL